MLTLLAFLLSTRRRPEVACCLTVGASPKRPATRKAVVEATTICIIEALLEAPLSQGPGMPCRVEQCVQPQSTHNVLWRSNEASPDHCCRLPGRAWQCCLQHTVISLSRGCHGVHFAQQPHHCRMQPSTKRVSCSCIASKARQSGPHLEVSRFVQWRTQPLDGACLARRCCHGLHVGSRAVELRLSEDQAQIRRYFVYIFTPNSTNKEL